MSIETHVSDYKLQDFPAIIAKLPRNSYDLIHLVKKAEWCTLPDLNQRPPRYEREALTS